MKPLERQGFLYLENFFLIFKKEIIEKISTKTKPLVRVDVSRFFAGGIILNYIIWYKVGNVRLRKMILKKEITPQTQCYQGFLRKIKEITKISKTANA